MDNRIKSALGQRLKSLRRHVLGYGTWSDELGHGITELIFERVAITISPGPNEDYIEFLLDGPDHARMIAGGWRPVDLSRYEWLKPGGPLIQADLFAMGDEVRAIELHFESGERFGFVLTDTDLCLKNAPELRKAIANEGLELWETIHRP